MIKSPLQIAREKYIPKMPQALTSFVKISEGEKTHSVADQADIAQMFPNTYGMPLISFVEDKNPPVYPAFNVAVILSGGQAPGGHNVISGIFDGLKKINPASKLFGFKGGPSGLTDNDYIELTKEIIDHYRNTGGFDIIGSGRTKLEETAQFDLTIENCKKLNINAIVIIGGDDSNTNACVLAEYFLQKKCGIQVIGVPKTIDGDLKNEMIETSFGFDTACKVYSELIGNIQRDANSAKKYWHFIKLMGRSASHIALECALQTQPNICLISEEVADKKMTLDQVVHQIADAVIARAKKGENFGSCLVPEGLIEFIPEMKQLIEELNEILTKNAVIVDNFESNKERRGFVAERLTGDMSKLFNSIPSEIANQLCLDRDPHGNVQVSMIDTEKLLKDMVKAYLKDLKKQGKFDGKFATQVHFFGYEGRCAAPSNFDADYCYSLGYTAANLVASGKSGYMASVRNLTQPADQWIAGGVPITMMMNMERRHGKMKPVIQKALVLLDGAPFKTFAKQRDEWAVNMMYIYPGPIQYFGPKEVCDQPTKTLKLEQDAMVMA